MAGPANGWAVAGGIGRGAHAAVLTRYDVEAIEF